MAIVIISIIIPSCWSVLSDTDGVPTPSGSATITYITTSANHVWVVDSNGVPYVCENPCTGDWTQHSEGLRVQVDANNYEVWGITSNGNIHRRPVDGSGRWYIVVGNVKHVSASGYGYIWAISSNDYIFKCKIPCTSHEGFEPVSGRLRLLDGGPRRVYGVGADESIWTRPVDGSGSWQRISGSLKHITVGHDYLYGVNSNNYFYRCATPCLDGNWELLNDDGHIVQSDASYNYLYMLTDAGAIYRSTSNEH